MKRSKHTLKSLKARERRLKRELEKVEEEIGALIDKEREEKFFALKEKVESWNMEYDGHFVEELKERWDEEPDEKD